MPGLFDDIPAAKPVTPAPQSKGLFDDIPAAKPAEQPKPQGRGIVQALKDYPAHVLEGLLNTPKAAFEASEERRKGGDYQAGPIVDAALLGVGPSVAGSRLKMTPKAGEAPKPPPEMPKAPEAASETISAAAIKSKQGQVFSGVNHGDAATNLFKAGHELDPAEAGDGFVTSTGRFVDRDEALDIAAKNKQLHDPDLNHQNRPDAWLHARDLDPATLPKAPAKAAPAPAAPKPAAAPAAAKPADLFADIPAATPPIKEHVVGKVGTFLNKIFNPEKIGKGERAETVIRKELGTAARDTETTKAAFDGYYKAVNALDDNDKTALIGYIEGRTKGATIKDPALQPVADAVKTAVETRQTKLQALPSTHQMAFVEDYYTHQWENPQAAQAFVKSWTGKQGTGANLKKRSIPTIADGMAAGLKPKTLNPLETITDYVTNMDRFIAHNAIIDAGRAVKDVKYYRNPQIAAKLGLTKLEGRLGMRRTKYGDMQAYAPPDWARVYNNSIAKGWHQWETAGQIYDKLQTASNSITAMELGLSGYHLLTMVNEGSIASVATAISQAISGAGALSRGEMKLGAKLLAGSAKSAATAPFALGVKPYMGHKAQQVYLGRSAGSTQMRKTMDLLEAGGGRAIGTKHAADYKFSAAQSYFTAFKRGELGASFKADASKGPLRFFARQIGRTLQSFAQPLFEVYIPKMKVGAFHENMSAWLQANPAASYPEQVQMAKRIWDSVDNRFGEVVQDNIFWHTMLKQTAQLGMRSYSWNLGTVREIGGGAKGLLQTKGKGLGLKGQGYDPKTGYVVALPITVAITNAIYQYAMTGKMPEDLTDLVAPRTGGEVPGSGGHGHVEERAQLPGYQKDVFGWYEDWYTEMLNKRSSLVSTLGEVAANRDWKNDPIVNPEHSAPEWMKEYFQYAEKFLPISVKQGMQGEKKGSALGLQSYLGIRPSPEQFTDPQSRGAREKHQGQQTDKKRFKAGARQKNVYGGPTE